MNDTLMVSAVKCIRYQIVTTCKFGKNKKQRHAKCSHFSTLLSYKTTVTGGVIPISESDLHPVQEWTGGCVWTGLRQPRAGCCGKPRRSDSGPLRSA